MAVTQSVVLYDPTEIGGGEGRGGVPGGYSGRTREAYTLDLRQFCGWCDKHHLQTVRGTLTHIEF